MTKLWATQDCAISGCNSLCYTHEVEASDCPPELRGICENCAQRFLNACGLELCYRCDYRLTDATHYTVINGGKWHTCTECSEDHAMLMHCGGYTEPHVIGVYQV